MASLAVAPIHRLTVDDVLAMVEAEILTEYDRVELVDGVLLDLSPQTPKHEVAKERLVRYFGHDAGHDVRVESMLLIGGGYLLPDLQIDEDFPVEELPRTAQLVVEVANTSHRRDRDKLVDYARAGVPEYWIVDVISEVVVVHRDPGGDVYATVTEHRDGVLQPLLDAPPLALTALFSRA